MEASLTANTCNNMSETFKGQSNNRQKSIKRRSYDDLKMVSDGLKTVFDGPKTVLRRSLTVFESWVCLWYWSGGFLYIAKFMVLQSCSKQKLQDRAMHILQNPVLFIMHANVMASIS